MKSAEYVALVTGVYRAALDRAAGAPDSFQVRDGELAVLGESFSRGFSEAYLDRRARQRHDELPAAQQPGRARGQGFGDRFRAAPPSRSTRRWTAGTPSSSGRRRAASRNPWACSSTQAVEHRWRTGGTRATVACRALGHHGGPGVPRAQCRALGCCRAHLLGRADGARRSRSTCVSSSASPSCRVSDGQGRQGAATGRRRRARTYQGRERRGGRRARRPARRNTVSRG